MRNCTLIFLFDTEGKILLGMKKRWFWEGKWNGFGGKIDANETIIAWARRELEEESWIQLPEEALTHHGKIHFIFEWKPEWEQDVHIFSHRGYSGVDPIETEEMKPEWFQEEDIPYESMWEDDPYWLPRMIQWEQIQSEAIFDIDGKLSIWKDL